MLVPFCSVCDQKCSSTETVTTRHFQRLGMLLGGQTAGLEIVPLTNGQFSENTHICNECFGKLILVALGETDPTLSTKKKELEDKEKHLKGEEQIFSIRRQQFDAEVSLLEKRKRELLELERNVAGAITERDERIRVLEAQVNALNIEKSKLWRQATAQANQAIEDMKNNPRYLERVEVREAVRRGVVE